MRLIKMSRQNTKLNTITEEQFFDICKNQNRNLNRARLEIKNSVVNNIKTNTPLFKEVMKDIGVDYI